MFNEVISGHFLALLSAWKSLSIWENQASLQFFHFQMKLQLREGNSPTQSHTARIQIHAAWLLSSGYAAFVSCFLDTSLALQPTEPCTVTGMWVSTETAFPSLGISGQYGTHSPPGMDPLLPSPLKVIL